MGIFHCYVGLPEGNICHNGIFPNFVGTQGLALTRGIGHRLGHTAWDPRGSKRGGRLDESRCSVEGLRFSYATFCDCNLIDVDV